MFDIPLLNNLFISFLNLFISLTELKNIHLEHPLKEHRYKMKIDNIIYLKSSSRTTYDDSKNKPSLYP